MPKSRSPTPHSKLPGEVSDAQAMILLSDIFPTAHFGADIAGIKLGHTAAVLGCGPVSRLAAASAELMDAGRMFAGDAVPSRLGTTRAQGAETANFEEEHPVETLIRLTGGGGVGCIIDAVGVDSYHAHQRPAAKPKKSQKGQLQGREWKRTTPPVTTSGAVTGFSAIDAYNSSDERKPGLIKAELEPQAMAT